jgi:hypothetical protein
MPRAALQQAAHEGVELIHLVCDGIVSTAYEGILYLLNTTSPELGAAELSDCLKGSRVRVLALTETQSGSSDVIPIGGRDVRSAFRAFAYLGRSPAPLPNIVAPLGPHSNHIASFWMEFYRGLAETLEIEQAMARGRQAVKPEAAAVALFLRQNARRTFHQLEAEESPPVLEPTQMKVDLQQSRELVGQFNALRTQFGDLPESVKRLLDTENKRQAKLEASLERWLG